jgi:hypothetical protein
MIAKDLILSTAWFLLSNVLGIDEVSDDEYTKATKYDAYYQTYLASTTLIAWVWWL